MAYFIQKPSRIDESITVYYVGNGRWSDDPTQKALFASENAATEIMTNSDGKNGGWSNVTIISE